MLFALLIASLLVYGRCFLQVTYRRVLLTKLNLLMREDEVPISGKQREISTILSFGKNLLQSSLVAATPLASLTLNRPIANVVDLTPTMVSPVVVLGANGKTGRLIVDLLAKQGIPVRPTRRSTDGKVSGPSGEKVLPEMAADVTKIESLESAIKNARVVIFTASASNKGGNAQQVDYLGVENVAKECVRLQIPRLIVVSSGAVTKPNSLGYKITNIFGSIMDYKIRGENALRNIYRSAYNSDISYAIIRPGGLQDGSAISAKNIELNQGDTIIGEINRSDLAECVAAAAVSTALPRDVTFEVYSKDKRYPLEGRFPQQSGYERRGDTYDEMFQVLKSGDINII